MNHEKRLLLALILSIVVCGWWAQWMTKKEKIRREKIKKQKQLEKNKNKPQKIDKKTEKVSDQPEKVPNETEKNPQPEKIVKKAESTEKLEEKEYQNEIYAVKWTNHGAALRWLKFKKFLHGYATKKGVQIEESEKWMKIIPNFSDEMATLAIYDDDIGLEKVYWEVVQRPNQNSPTLEFRYHAQKQNLVFSKKFIFYPDKHKISGELTIENLKEEEQKIQLRLAGGAGILVEGMQENIVEARAMYPNEKNYPLYEEFSHKELTKEDVELTQDISWVALSNRYFSHVLQIEQNNYIEKVSAKAFSPESSWVDKTADQYKKYGEPKKAKEIRKKNKQAILFLHTKKLTIPAKGKDPFKLNFHFFVDSKEHLAKADKSFAELNDYGFFGSVSNFLLWILNLFYKLFHSYGIAIICLTLAIKICLYPLSRKQQVSMQDYQKKMSKFQPQMKKLQEKYKNNKQKLQEEMIKLYKQHNVNPIPLGGCLPIFLQLPIFIGLYSALSYSIHLRQASFLWIHDLSLPDRLWRSASGFDLNILPLVMTVIWFIQMKTAPQPEDPQMQQQQKIMMIMPIVFGFMFYEFASGLVLYWLIMQLITVIEQAWIKKTHKTET